MIRRVLVLILIACAGYATVLMVKNVQMAERADVYILETGSSLLYPLFNLWVPAFARLHPHVKITTQSTGSGTGISQSVEELVQIGASDAYLSNALERMHGSMLNIPLAISMQMVNYNLPGLNGPNLRLSGPVLAAMYQGRIRKWNDSRIAAMNPGVKLPDHDIIPLHRSDGSGDTFVFTQYLAFTSPEWQKILSYGTTVSWPSVPDAMGAEGNPGMLTALEGSPYSIGYIGTSYQDAIERSGLGIAQLKNRDGNFVLPTQETATAGATAMVSKTPADGRISLIFAPGPQSYPIINYEYAIVNSRQPDAKMAAALRTFFTWAIGPNGGNAPQFMQGVHFVALPEPVVKLSLAQIARIAG